MNKRWLLILGIVLLVVLAACQETGTGSDEMTVTVDVDGTSQIYRYHKRISVGQFLEEIGVTLSQDDEVNPLLQTQLRDGMRVTVSRVVKREECEEEVLPYETERQFTQGLPAGEQRIAQTGENGTIQICYRITEKDGVEVSRTEISRIPIRAPRNEIIYVGREPPETLVPIEGALAYISGGQAWIIESNTTKLRPLTTAGHLNGQVFDLSPDGQYLLYTRSTEDDSDPEFANELWAILDTTANAPQPVQLVPNDVRLAQWVPGQSTPTVSYSTAEPTNGVPNWQAYNDLYLMQLNPENGETLALDEIIRPNALGVYAYWGRRYAWSPDGTQLAWALADGVGLVDLETGDFIPLLTFPEYATALVNFWVWVPKLSWSENDYLITTVHGPSYGAESPEDSIIFDMAITNASGELQINPFFSQSGIWACPTYSPVIDGPDGNPTAYIAYFQAREPLNSPGSQYDLVVADSDGSNTRVLFPGPDKQGLRPDPEDGITWSPLARQIALIYQKNLWIVDVETGLAHQITSDEQASRPRWSRER
ncbi:MAG: G5 domain-containing protein [Anaerolineae bacterium]|nr:G5 domain-containing protein [Anaerolineae bacterium]